MGWATREAGASGWAALALLAVLTALTGCAAPEQQVDTVGQDVWSQVRTLQLVVRADRRVDGITTPLDVAVTEAGEGLADAERQARDLPAGTARRAELLAVIGRARAAVGQLRGAIQHRDTSGVDQVEHTLGALAGQLDALGVSR